MVRKVAQLFLFILPLSMMAFTLNSFCAGVAPKWNSENQYRLIVELKPDQLDRKNCPVSIEICFPKIFAELGIDRGYDKFARSLDNDRLDRNSIQVIAYDRKTGNPKVFDSSLSGEKKYVIPSRIFYPSLVYSSIAYDVVAWNMQDNSSTLFAIYFDTYRSGPLPQPEYYPMIGAGEPIMCQQGRFTASVSTWGDLDGDGLEDMVVGGVNEIGYLSFAKNIGTKEMPRFSQSERLVSGTKFINCRYRQDERVKNYYAVTDPLLVDWDNDGDLDLYIKCNYWFANQHQFYENVGNYLAHRFVPSTNPPELSKIKEFLEAGTIDWDNDGRPEKISSHKRFLLYHSSLDAAGIPIAGFDEFISCIRPYNIDNDGYKDIIVGLHEGTVLFCRNLGILRGEPYFARPKKLLAHNADLSGGSFSAPATADWDGDGDIDIFSGAESGKITYFENFGTKQRPVFIEKGYLHADGEPITFSGDIREPNGEHWGYSTLSVLDWDSDGDYDVLATERMGYTNYYENVGSKTKPRLTFVSRLKLEDGTDVLPNPRVKPGFYDWNGDGYHDIIMAEKASQSSAIFYNAGARNRLTFKKPESLNGPDGNPLYREPYKGAGRTRYVPVDWNSDGKMDFIIADHIEHGWPQYFENIGAKTEPSFVRKDDPKVKEHHLWVGKGHETCPWAIDWDQDGREDILLGGDDGRIRYYNRKFFEAPPELKNVSASSKSSEKVYDCLPFVDIDRYVEKYKVFCEDLNNAAGAEKWVWNTNTTAHNYNALTLESAQGNEKIVYDPNLKGIYDIYVAFDVIGKPAKVKIKLSGDATWEPMQTTVYMEEFKVSSDFAQPKNHFEQVYWKEADMTGQKVEIIPEKASRVYLDYIKFIPQSRIDLLTQHKE